MWNTIIAKIDPSKMVVLWTLSHLTYAGTGETTAYIDFK